MTIKEHLTAHFRGCASSPFLFLGSGFSRRYLGLEDWQGLLERFCRYGREFGYYYSTCNGNLAEVASLIANDIHEAWWSHVDFVALKEKYAGQIRDKEAAFKVVISEYIRERSNIVWEGHPFADELALLRNLNVDGVITTNWDLLTESLYPDFKVFTGQDELLFSSPQAIAEIYKIHGCCTQPGSLVLTQKNYDDFAGKNAYLSSKLLTLFIEHPIVFIGYSLSDPHIQKILSAIVFCLGEHNLAKLQNNLIFINRPGAGEEEHYSKTSLYFDQVQLPITVVKTASFVPVYEAMLTVRRKLPVKILRYCKEQIYELVKNNDPRNKLYVTEIDQIRSPEEVEFVMGVGAIENQLSAKGYERVRIDEVFQNLVLENNQILARHLLSLSLPEFLKNAKWIPIFKFLRECGVTSQGAYAASGFQLDTLIALTKSDYETRGYDAQWEQYRQAGTSVQDIIRDWPAEKAAIFIALLDENALRDQLEEVRNFLVTQFDLLASKGHHRAAYKKLACLYDRLMYGWL